MTRYTRHEAGRSSSTATSRLPLFPVALPESWRTHGADATVPADVPAPLPTPAPVDATVAGRVRRIPASD